MPEIILSAGIDIGTTTTQLIFSILTMEKTGGYGVTPKVEVVNREVIYKSKIYFTPLTVSDDIDGLRVAEIISNEYANAGMTPNMLGSGAVIITGETAKKRNAEQVTKAIANLAGEFVVAAAGPDFESLLAGKGSGAAARSEKEKKVVLNLDIGGGTTNLCMFSDGKEVDFGCYDIGGRVIRYNSNHIIEKITPKMEYLLKNSGINVTVGDELTENLGNRVGACLAELLLEAANLRKSTYLTKYFETNHGLEQKIIAEEFCFSGGVADCINNEYDNPFIYGDIGIFLGRAIRNNPYWKKQEIIFGDETVRATVIGAGNCSMEVSGSTIYAQNAKYPVKNLPVQKLACVCDEEIASLNEQLTYLKSQRTETYHNGYALSLEGPECPSFEQVEAIADSLVHVILCENHMIPIIIQNDFAKALGQAIKRRLPKDSKKAVLCLDQVICGNGDFIDIGKPVGGDIALPVIVKTLIFQKEGGNKI